MIKYKKNFKLNKKVFTLIKFFKNKFIISKKNILRII